jgi:hypothetical protein
MTCLQAQDLDPEAFLKLIEKTLWPKDCLLLAFTPAAARLASYAFDREFLAATDHGRIFGPWGELKWRRLDGLVRVVYLGEDLSLPLKDYPQQLAKLEDSEDTLFLWGRRTDLQDEWLEQQVPQRFTFPITGKTFSRGRVALRVEHWGPPNGWPVFSRYHSLTETTGED